MLMVVKLNVFVSVLCYGLKKVEGATSVCFYARRLFWAFPLGLDKVAHCFKVGWQRKELFSGKTQNIEGKKPKEMLLEQFV